MYLQALALYTLHRMKLDADGYGCRKGTPSSTVISRPRSSTSASRTRSKYAGLDSAAQAAVSAATDTLYGCLARQRYSTMPSGKEPYPTLIPVPYLNIVTNDLIGSHYHGSAH